MLNGPDVHPGANVLERKNGESISLRYVERKTLELENGDIVFTWADNGDVTVNRVSIKDNSQPTVDAGRIDHPTNDDYVKELFELCEASVAVGFMSENPLKDFVDGDMSDQNYNSIDLHKHVVDKIILCSESI